MMGWQELQARLLPPDGRAAVWDRIDAADRDPAVEWREWMVGQLEYHVALQETVGAAAPAEADRVVHEGQAVARAVPGYGRASDRCAGRSGAWPVSVVRPARFVHRHGDATTCERASSEARGLIVQAGPLCGAGRGLPFRSPTSEGDA